MHSQTCQTNIYSLSTIGNQEREGPEGFPKQHYCTDSTFQGFGGSWWYLLWGPFLGKILYIEPCRWDQWCEGVGHPNGDNQIVDELTTEIGFLRPFYRDNANTNSIKSFSGGMAILSELFGWVIKLRSSCSSNISSSSLKCCHLRNMIHLLPFVVRALYLAHDSPNYLKHMNLVCNSWDLFTPRMRINHVTQMFEN